MLGMVMGELRRAFSVAVVRVQTLYLLDMLAHLGPGARVADKRQAVTLRQEEHRRHQRQAFFLAIQGRGLSRIVSAFIPLFSM